MTEIRPTVASLFSGAGGLDLGFKWANFDLAWANELELDAAETYKSYISNHLIRGDIRELVKQIPSVDVLIGGPPCQSFSLVGKRRPDDPRGSLVFAFVDAVANTRPRAFLLENVPGLLSSRLGDEKLLDVLLTDFHKMGYETRTITSMASDYLVPQRRRRVFVIGWQGQAAPSLLSEVVPIFPGGQNSETPMPISASQALGDLPQPTSGPMVAATYAVPFQNAYQAFVRAGSNEVLLHHQPTMSMKDREFIKHIPPGGNYMDIPDEYSTKRILNFKETGGRTTTYGRLHPDRPAFTINTYFNRPNVGTNYHYSEERLITVREALRLQSFPDWFTPVFGTQRSLHQQVGNAVPPLLAFHLARSIRSVFE